MRVDGKDTPSIEATDIKSNCRGCIKGVLGTNASILEFTPYKNILGGKHFIAT